MIDGGRGGWMIGLELGVQVSMAGQRWQTTDGAEVAGIDAQRLTTGYIKLTIGGGGFFLK
jgi:hypothetical protein